MTIIDKNTWPRRGIYDFFAPMSDPFYTLTFPVDVTPLRAWCKAGGLPFYPAMVFAVTRAMEHTEAFLYKDRGGTIVRHDTLVPSFTDLRPGSDQFHIVTLEAGEDPADFCRRAKAASAAQREFITAGPWPEDQLVYFTCLPWFPVTALKNERDLDPAEVAEVFCVPVDWLKANPPAVYTYDLVPQVGKDFPYERIGFPQGYRWRGGKVEVPVYDWPGYALWGLTARITRRLMEQMP